MSTGHRPTNEIPHDVSTLLKHYQCRTGEISGVTGPLSGGFSGALVFCVQAQSGEKYALRRWPASQEPQPLRAHLSRMEWLYQQGVKQVALPIRTANDDGITGHQGHWWHLEQWKSGRSLLETGCTLKALKSAMKAVAQLHSVSHRLENRQTQQEFLQPSAAVTARRNLLRQVSPGEAILPNLKLGNAVTSEWDKVYRDAMDRYSFRHATLTDRYEAWFHRPLRTQFLFRDLWAAHVIVEADECTGLIDPSLNAHDHPVVDLARLLSTTLGAVWTSDWDDALESYNRGNPLASDEVELLRLLGESSCLLSAIQWFRRLSDPRQAFSNEQSPFILQRLKQLLMWDSGRTEILRPEL